MKRDQEPPRRSDTPTPGFYRIRLVKNGPWQPARIIHEDGLWFVMIAGEMTQPAPAPDPWSVRRMDWVAWAPSITEAEYYEMREHAPEHGSPLADAQSPVDWRRGKSLF